MRQSKLRRGLRVALVRLAIVYACALASLALAWSVGAAWPWPLALSNIFAVYFFVPGLPLLLLGLWLGSRRFWLALAVPAALFMTLFGSYLLPPPAAASGPRLRLLTANLLYHNDELGPVEAYLRAQDADIVLVQELSREAAEALARDLADAYPYQLLRPADNWDGLGVLSRHPIGAAPAPAGDPVQAVEVTIDGRALLVLNVHPRAPQLRVRNIQRVSLPRSFSTEERDATLARLVAQIDARGAPQRLVVAGDFNLTEREAPYQALSQRLANAYEVAGWGFGPTFPAKNVEVPAWIPFPLIRIDHVWSSPDLPPQRAEVLCDLPGSDHCALLVELGLEN